MRHFGIEMELVGLTTSQAVQILATCGVAHSTDTGYRHSDYNVWKVQDDSSIRYDNGACEVVSRKLPCNEEGYTEVRAVARALARAGARVNRSCGLHVHLSADDLTVDHVRAILRRYMAAEPTFDSMMPASRRDNQNQFCQSLNRFLNDRVMDSWRSPETRNQRFNAATTFQGLIDVVHNRYAKVNITNLVRRGTIEFRQHSGSVNATKILNWVQFLVTFVDTTVNGIATDTTTARTRTRTAPATRRNNVAANNAQRSATEAEWNGLALTLNNGQRNLLNALRRGGAYTRTSALRTSVLATQCGISPGTVGAYMSGIRRAGFILRTVRNPGDTRYYLVHGVLRADVTTETAETAPAGVTRARRTSTPRRSVNSRQAVTVSAAPADIFAGLDPEVFAYFNERIQDLS